MAFIHIFIHILYELQYELIEPLNLLFESPYKPIEWKMVMLLQCTKNGNKMT